MSPDSPPADYFGVERTPHLNFICLLCDLRFCQIKKKTLTCFEKHHPMLLERILGVGRDCVDGQGVL